MAVKPRITYDAKPFRLTDAQQTAHLKVLLPPNLLPPSRNETHPDRQPLPPWEGTTSLPVYPGHYGIYLFKVLAHCEPELLRHRVRLDNYIHHRDRIRLSPQFLAQRGPAKPWLSGRFQLGRAYGGQSPVEALALLKPGEIALDPANILLILTMAVMEHGVEALQPMWIDCPGAEYDPEGKKKFSDCPRWNVSTDPSDKDAAFLSLDWNWSANLRARANHGSATMLLEP